MRMSVGSRCCQMRRSNSSPFPEEPMRDPKSAIPNAMCRRSRDSGSCSRPDPWADAPRLKFAVASRLVEPVHHRRRRQARQEGHVRYAGRFERYYLRLFRRKARRRILDRPPILEFRIRILDCRQPQPFRISRPSIQNRKSKIQHERHQGQRHRPT